VARRGALAEIKELAHLHPDEVHFKLEDDFTVRRVPPNVIADYLTIKI